MFCPVAIEMMDIRRIEQAYAAFARLGIEVVVLRKHEAFEKSRMHVLSPYASGTN